MLERLLLAGLIASTLGLSFPAWAEGASSPAVNAALEERVNHLSSELRCLVCQNQSVADSQAPLAVQLKREVRSQLAAGASDDEVRAFMVQRYGDFVLYRPPVKGQTLALWLAPGVILLLSLLALGIAVRSRRLRGDDDEEIHFEQAGASAGRQG